MDAATSEPGGGRRGEVVGVARGEPSYDPTAVRALVRAALRLAGEPLDDLIRPGQTVCLKPNWIAGAREGEPQQWVQIITHPAVLRCVVEEVATRLGSGRIIIADAPQTDSDFELIASRAGLDGLMKESKSGWPGIELEVVDLRQEYWVQKGGVTVKRRVLPGDPRGAVAIDLSGASEFVAHSGNHHYYGADYDFADTRAHHAHGTHEYLVSRSVLEADVFINLPKLKTHKKAGVTLSLKNLVGINADKNYLPHYCLGPPGNGGDEFPDAGLRRRLESRLSRSFKKLIATRGGNAPVWGPAARAAGVRAFRPSSEVVRSGNWWGNDTLWRMCLDLNKVLLWFDGDGRRRAQPKPYLSIVDGIVAGEGNGPVDADPIDLGVIVAGTDAVAVDLVCSRLIGFDWTRIPVVARALEVTDLPVTAVTPQSVIVSTDDPPIEHRGLEGLAPAAFFRPHFGWTGHIELDPAAVVEPR